MHDFLSTFSVKAAEYAIGIGFLLCFVPFWRFVNGGAPAPALARAAHRAANAVGDFLMPEHVHYHPGHAWAAMSGKLATVGMDDFAHKLVGGISALELPQVGQRVGQGERAIRIKVGDRAVEMLSPMDGKVVAVNDAVLASPKAVKDDPYGAGWLFKVEPERPDANLKHLLSGKAAARWMDQVWEDLRARMSPELGLVAQDGGAPVDGIAPNLDPANWDKVAKTFFLS